MSRVKNSLTNFAVAIIGQTIALTVSFIARIFFIRILGAEYLGINGLFTNIVTMLSLVELGIGPAIIFSLYKPLAENDIKKVQALMQLYKKAYTIIGFIVAVLGVCIAPFLHYFIKELPDISNITLIYVLFVINSAISYFFAYKRNLIIADQRRYVDMLYRYSFFAILNIMQMIFLYITGSYIIFLILQITSTLLENIVVARRADKMYPLLKQRKHEKLDFETVQEIKKNTGAMVLHKIGDIALNATDNIVISAKVGIIWVGLYSNYLLIITALNIMIGQFFTSITASIGNFGITEGKEKVILIFQKVLFANFWMYGLSGICLYYLFNPFIDLWLGEDLLMDMNVVGVLVINFFIQGMRRSVLTFIDALGLYWHKRYKPLFEVAINLVVSLVLAPILGITGVFIGTLVSILTTCFWIEPYVLYTNGFNISLKPYFSKYALYTFITVLTGFLTGHFVGMITGSTIVAFIGKLAICLLIPNLTFLILFFRTKEFQYFKSIVKNVINRV